MKTPELKDIYRFFVKMHGDEETARIDFERFLAGELPPRVLAYCRSCIAVPEPQQLDQSAMD